MENPKFGFIFKSAMRESRIQAAAPALFSNCWKRGLEHLQPADRENPLNLCQLRKL